MTDVDRHLRAIVELHFGEGGAPFWRDKAEELSFDPLEDVNSIEDLRLFNEDEEYTRFPAEKLKSTPRDFIPQQYENHAYRLYSSGGRTGEPKWTAWVDDGSWERLLNEIDTRLDDLGVPYGSDWAYIGPTGPHPFGYFPRDLAPRRNGQYLTVDLDPRWVRRSKTDESLAEDGIAQQYLDHLRSQTQSVLSQFGTEIGILVSTPTVIGMLAENGALQRLNLDAVIFAGQPMKPENYQALDQHLEAALIGWYGNTLTGIYPQRNFDAETGDIVYDPLPSLAIPEVIEEGTPFEPVEYGSRGRVVVHVLREGLFAPYHVEDDAAKRVEIPTTDHLSGVANPDILQDKTDDIESGVY